MRFIIKIILLQIFMSTIVADYYDLESINTIQPNDLTRNNSNFGFSIAYFEKRLIIGAPTADNIGRLYSYNIKKGIIFNIPTIITRDPSELSPQDYWFGANLKSTKSFIVSCAPRTIYKINHKSVDYNINTGKCYKITNEMKLLPAIDEVYLEQLNGGINGLGWNIEVDSKNKILIGGHASEHYGVRMNPDDFTPADMFFINETVYNFGYSVVSGKFLSDDAITYAISSTFGSKGEGQIFFYNESKEKHSETLTGSAVGSMYGATLCAVILKGKHNSLLVGAPAMSYNNNYDNGAVYLYEPDYELISGIPKLSRVIYGTVNGGYFGSAIISIGDMDGDGMDEVAIGAPYEGKGAVYIYTGHGLVYQKTWLQKIQPETFSLFGFSLTRIDNFYERACNELAVGAPGGNKAFLIKCIPAVTVHMTNELPNLQKREDRSHFEITTCLNVTFPAGRVNIEFKMRLKVEITHPDARFEVTDDDGYFTYDYMFKSGIGNLCQNINVLTPEGNYEEMIKFNFSAVMVEPDIITENTIVALSDRSVVTLQKSVWAANCKKYGRCQPQLSAEVFTTISDPYKVGVLNTELFSLRINNDGEPAYNACAVVTLKNTFIHRPALLCTVLTKWQVLCKPSQVIPSGFSWPTGDIEIDTTSLTNLDEDIEIQYDIYSHCGDESDNVTNVVTYELTFNYDKINVIGTSNPSNILNVTQTKNSNGTEIQHMYTIINNGLITYSITICSILLERSSYINHHNAIMTYRSPERSRIEKNECSSKILNDNTMRVSCSIETLAPNSETNIFLTMNVQPPNGIDNLLITSNFTLPISKQKIVKSVTTTISIQSTSLPLWIWIVTVIIGLLLLLIVVLILRQCGCLKRKNKEKLESLKKSQKSSKQMPRNRNQEVRFSSVQNSVTNREEQFIAS